MRYRWVIQEPDEAVVSRLRRKLAVSELMARCMFNRGLTTEQQASVFLHPRLRDLKDPMLLPNMEVMTDRLWEARIKQERIVVFGDYDVDGVTSTALLLEIFERLGFAQPEIYLPHRLEEGYGLSQSAVSRCVERYDPDLVLAVDCGSTSNETVDWLNGRGIDVLVLDHHQLTNPAPKAMAIVNPQVSDDANPPFGELCSAGLAFKLAHALIKIGRHEDLQEAHEIDLRLLLDLVALGTVADLVPLSGENRILVSKGLECLRRTSRAGLAALKEVAQIQNNVGVFEVGFQLSPRLNAAGRLENAQDALDLLRSSSFDDGVTLAQELDHQNRERQRIEKMMSDECVQKITDQFQKESHFAIVEGNTNWHVGIVGIVASRVMRAFYRPTIIIGSEGEEWRGSGRSIEGFDLAAALRECDDLLIRHGGHAMAAGLSIHPKNLDQFRERLNSIAKREIGDTDLRPRLRLDAETPLNEMNMDRLIELNRLQPSGQANPKVQLVARNLRNTRPPRRIGHDQQHAKLLVTNGSVTLESIWWNCEDNPLPKNDFDLAFEPLINEFNGRKQIQLKLLDWRPSKEK